MENQLIEWKRKQKSIDFSSCFKVFSFLFRFQLFPLRSSAQKALGKTGFKLLRSFDLKSYHSYLSLRGTGNLQVPPRGRVWTTFGRPSALAQAFGQKPSGGTAQHPSSEDQSRDRPGTPGGGEGRKGMGSCCHRKVCVFQGLSFASRYASRCSIARGSEAIADVWQSPSLNDKNGTCESKDSSPQQAEAL